MQDLSVNCEMIICPKCHGEREVRVYNYYKYAFNPGRVGWETCGRCHGKGGVQAPEKQPA
jgi:hypothetical protein